MPGSKRLVRPVGKGIPLSDVYMMSVSLSWPDADNSERTRPIPGKRNT